MSSKLMQTLSSKLATADGAASLGALKYPCEQRHSCLAAWKMACAGHGRSLLDPGGQKLVSLQAAHSAAPFVEKLPDAQGSQAAAPAAANLPAEQSLQCSRMAAPRAFPASHGSHDVLPVRSAYRPAPQSAHAATDDAVEY